MLDTFLKCLLIHHYSFMFKNEVWSGNCSLVSCVGLVDWGLFSMNRRLVGLSIGESPIWILLFSGNLRCIVFLTNPLISCGGGEIDLAKGVLETELCLDQIKIYFFCLWPWVLTDLSILESGTSMVQFAQRVYTSFCVLCWGWGSECGVRAVTLLSEVELGSTQLNPYMYCHGLFSSAFVHVSSPQSISFSHIIYWDYSRYQTLGQLLGETKKKKVPALKEISI